MPKIIIKGSPINVPDSGASPNWAPGIIEAIKALADAINSVAATFDVPPQVQNIDANNTATNIIVSNLSFPASEVRAATVYYSVLRKTENSGPIDSQELTESGTLEIEYNESRPPNTKWQIVRSGMGDANMTFDVTDLGQIRFSTTPLTGINHTGIISYRAISILNK